MIGIVCLCAQIWQFCFGKFCCYSCVIPIVKVAFCTFSLLFPTIFLTQHLSSFSLLFLTTHSIFGILCQAEEHMNLNYEIEFSYQSAPKWSNKNTFKYQRNSMIYFSQRMKIKWSTTIKLLGLFWCTWLLCGAFVSVTTDKCQFHSNSYLNQIIFLFLLLKATHLHFIHYCYYCYLYHFRNYNISNFGCVKIMNFMQIKSQNFDIDGALSSLLTLGTYTKHILEIASFPKVQFNEYICVEAGRISRNGCGICHVWSNSVTAL